METTPFSPPAFQDTGFNCPTCGAFAEQTWFYGGGVRSLNNQSFYHMERLRVSRCSRCNNEGFWIDEKLVSPRVRGAPPPNADLLDDIKRDYEEAASIEQISPRGAAALLRLCIQKLCKQLGKHGDNINADIAALVADGLPLEIKQALDVVRVVGNNAVHPGQIEVDDNRDIVSTLFKLINLIAERMVTMPKQVAALHDGLPASIKAGIEARDQKATAAAPPPRKP